MESDEPEVPDGPLDRLLVSDTPLRADDTPDVGERLPEDGDFSDGLPDEPSSEDRDEGSRELADGPTESLPPEDFFSDDRREDVSLCDVEEIEEVASEPDERLEGAGELGEPTDEPTDEPSDEPSDEPLGSELPSPLDREEPIDDRSLAEDRLLAVELTRLLVELLCEELS